MAEALITPDVLTWARKRSGLDSGQLAHRLNVKPEAVTAWEDAERRPTFRQAQRLAQTLHVPFGYLFLSEPPVQELPLPDLRTLSGSQPEEPSPNFLDLLYDTMNKQQWFREYRESEGVDGLPFVGRFTVSNTAETVAADIRDIVAIDEARSKANNWEGFLRQFIRSVEELGVMVLRSGVVGNDTHRPLDVEEFRGFAITDEVAPLIFINGRDFRGAQIFTLAHEMAHIWVGEAGVSNPDYSMRSIEQGNGVERFCNRVAAETLVPAEDFQRRWDQVGDTSEASLRFLTRHYQVSSMVVLRQAYDLDLIPAEVYWEGYWQSVERSINAGTAAAPGGNFYYTLTARNGIWFTSAVVSGVADGSLLHREAADLLNVHPKTLPGIAEHLFGGTLTLA